MPTKQNLLLKEKVPSFSTSEHSFQAAARLMYFTHALVQVSAGPYHYRLHYHALAAHTMSSCVDTAETRHELSAFPACNAVHAMCTNMCVYPGGPECVHAREPTYRWCENMCKLFVSKFVWLYAFVQYLYLYMMVPGSACAYLKPDPIKRVCMCVCVCIFTCPLYPCISSSLVSPLAPSHDCVTFGATC